MKHVGTWLLLAFFLGPASQALNANAATPNARVEQIRFAKGASSATLKGSITGDHFVDYRIRAAAGQSMSVSLTTSNGANYFNVLPPGSNDVALFVGSTSGSEWTGTLEANGEYTIRVYLMRSAARRGETANYTLSVGVAGAPAVGLGKPPASDAKVKGTPYHATGKVPCELGSDRLQCDFGVVRGNPGNADVHLKPPGGLERVLSFRGEEVTSDPGSKVKATRGAGEWSIEVNDFERYRIFDAVINGG
jgi:hypothetical protein